MAEHGVAWSSSQGLGGSALGALRIAEPSAERAAVAVRFLVEHPNGPFDAALADMLSAWPEEIVAPHRKELERARPDLTIR